MWTALTRRPGADLADCTLTHVPRRAISTEKALAQHERYRERLRRAGCEVVELPVLEGHPDACFVEDVAVVTDEVAVLARPAHESRRAEVASVAKELARRREVLRIEEPATLEGGDVLVADEVAIVGWSRRTSHAGLRTLAHLLLPHGLRVKAAEVRGCLHLKTALGRAGDDLLVANREWVDLSRVPGFEIVDVDPAEPFAANVLRLGDAVILPADAPRTAERLASRGVATELLDVSEFQKAEAGLTCLALLLRG